MKVYLVYAGIVAWIYGFMLISGCGGHKGISLIPQLSSNSSPVSPLAHADAGGLKTKLALNYSLAGFPTQQGITVVPLANESTAGKDKDRYAMSIAAGIQDPSTRTVTLSTQSARSIMAHVRFDPAVWRVKGVASFNQWTGTEQFLPVAVIVEPGVLLLNSTPLGLAPSANAMAQGEFAHVILEPASRKDTSFNAVTGSSSIGVAWDAQSDGQGGYDILHESVLHYRMDGKLADLSSKNGDLNGSDQTTEVADSLIHATIFYGMPHTFVKNQSWVNVGFNFNECLPGDCDNNGIVQLADITAMGAHCDTDGSPYVYGGMKGMRGTVLGTWSWINLEEKMETDPNPLYPWRRFQYPDLYAFWYLDLDTTWNDPPGYYKRDTNQSGIPSTQIVNAMDFNWDGVVKDWSNIRQLKGYGGVYDEPANDKYRPGDLGPLSKHWEEAISGYRVFTIPRNTTGYTAGNPPPTTPPTNLTACINAENWYRPGMAYPDFTGQTPAGPAAIQYSRPYFDSSWGEYDSTKALWKSELEQTFQENDFYVGDGNSDLEYDILIYPYLYADSTVTYGACSRISSAMDYLAEDTEAPYFVEPIGPCSPELPAKADFYVTSLSYDGSVGVYYWPAIDPPMYLDSADITYTCYYALQEFDIDDLTAPLPTWMLTKTSTFSYSDKYNENGFPKFDLESLSFILDNYGTPLYAGQQVWFIIIASDADGNESTNETVYTDAARDVDPSDSYEIVPPENLPRNMLINGMLVGDIKADGDAIYAVYPATGHDPDGSAANGYFTGDEHFAMSYLEYDGTGYPLANSTDAFSTATYQPNYMYGATVSAGLTHAVNANGSPSYDASDRRMPLVAFQGYDAPYDLEHTSTYFRDDQGSPSFFYHNETLSGPVFNFVGDHEIHAFTHGSGRNLVTDYVMAWDYFCGDPEWPVIPSGLRYTASDEPDNWPSSASTLEDNIKIFPGRADLVMHSSYDRCEFPVPSTGTNPPGRTLYLMVTEDKCGILYEDESGYHFQHIPDRLDIWSTTDAQNWVKTDVYAALPNLPENAGVQANGFTLVVAPNNGYHVLYVVYNDSDDSTAINANDGLKIAYSIDTGSGPTTWSNPMSGTMIDDSFRCCPSNEFDAVDLEVKPDGAASGNLMNQLGCVYITANGELIYAETVNNGGNVTWEKQGIDDMIDMGSIEWAKLAYLEDSEGIAIPYVLYSNKVIPGQTGGTGIYLWRPGGF